ncbi:MAG: hypothetical protein ACOC1X_02830 [Promethearchaeota archaeon]
MTKEELIESLKINLGKVDNINITRPVRTVGKTDDGWAKKEQLPVTNIQIVHKE